MAKRAPTSSPSLARSRSDRREGAEKRDQSAQLMRVLTDAEAELNERVYRLFNLTADEIKLLQKEVEH